MAGIHVKDRKTAQQYLQLVLDANPCETGNNHAEKQEETPAKREQRELGFQIALFAKRRVLLARYPPLYFLHATLNGVYIPPALLKQVTDSGLVKGVLDIRWDTAHVEGEGEHVKFYGGICIDMKDYAGKPTPEQLAWAEQLGRCGIRAYFCAGDREQGITPLQDAWWTLCAYGGITGEDHYRAELTREEERHLAEMLAQQNLARSQERVAKEARRLERALKQAAAPVPKAIKRNRGKA